MKDGILLLLAAVAITVLGLLFFRVLGEHSFAVLLGMVVLGLLLGGRLRFGKKKRPR